MSGAWVWICLIVCITVYECWKRFCETFVNCAEQDRKNDEQAFKQELAMREFCAKHQIVTEEEFEAWKAERKL